ncbi:MAG: hypothetical protein WBV88_00760, partial [Candidatus Rickettsiella isopodorum]
LSIGRFRPDDRNVVCHYVTATIGFYKIFYNFWNPKVLELIIFCCFSTFRIVLFNFLLEEEGTTGFFKDFRAIRSKSISVL